MQRPPSGASAPAQTQTQTQAQVRPSAPAQPQVSLQRGAVPALASAPSSALTAARSRIRSTSPTQGNGPAGRNLGVQGGAAPAAPSTTGMNGTAQAQGGQVVRALQGAGSAMANGAARQGVPPLSSIRPGAGGGGAATTLASAAAAAASVSSASPAPADSATAHQKGVPAFLLKLYSMIDDPKTDTLIYWAKDGRSFFIPDHQQFGQTLLPQFFKHANFTSFVRQLNMYGFKKVPHLQAAALSSFAPPNGVRAGSVAPSGGGSTSTPAAPQQPELWEFTNPKFMRGHPELLGSIVRKKSAKELAAAQAAQGGAGAGQDDAQGKKDEDADVDMDERRESSAAPRKHAVPALTGDAAVDPTLSQALALMSTHHSSLEKEIVALKSSNEMLWRQWMVSREEALKSEKKVDNIMRFLAGQFGGMNMGMAIDEGAGGPAAVSAGEASGDAGRLRRLGSQRMIGDGGLAASSSPSDVMSVDSMSPVKADDDIWEFDANGQLVKMKAPAKNKTPIRPGNTRNQTTPARRTFANMPHTNAQSHPSTNSSNSPDRFIDLDGSPEEKALGGVESREGSPPMINGAFSSGSTGRLSLPSKSGAMFPPTPTTVASPEGSSLKPSANNALTTYQPSTGVTGALASQLDPAILNLPLGALLGSTAGAQLLASLSQIAAHGLGQQQAGGQMQGGASIQPQVQTVPNGMDTAMTSGSEPPILSNGDIEDFGTGPADSTDISWITGPGDQSFEASEADPAPLPLDNILDANNLVAPTLSPAAQALGDPTLSGDPPPSAGFDPSAGFHMDTPNDGIPGVNDDVAVNWEDPEMARLLESFQRSNDAAGGAGKYDLQVGYPGGHHTGEDFGYSIPEDKMLDFEKFFDESIGGGGGDGAQSNADIEMDKLQEPTRKKRKTDERG